MSQKFSNDGRSRLIGAITNVATSLTVEAATADLFPIANTPDWLAKVNWFKATLENNLAQKEIIYVGVRNAGSGIFTNVLRGQEGTTARAYAAGSIVRLSATAKDIQDALNGTFEVVNAGDLNVTDDVVVGGDANIAGALTVVGVASAAPAVDPEDLTPLAQVTAIASSLTIQSVALAVDTIFSTAAAVTIPTGFAAGKVLGIYNNSDAPININQGAGLTLEYAGSALTGNRILTRRGLMFIMVISGTKYSALGAGLL